MESPPLLKQIYDALGYTYNQYFMKKSGVQKKSTLLS